MTLSRNEKLQLAKELYESFIDYLNSYTIMWQEVSGKDYAKKKATRKVLLKITKLCEESSITESQYADFFANIFLDILKITDKEIGEIFYTNIVKKLLENYSLPSTTLPTEPFCLTLYDIHLQALEG